MKRLVFLFIAIVIFVPMQAQLVGGENSYLRKGNRAFADGDYEASGEHYQSAIDANVQSHKGKFNLGDALYQQEKYTEAAQQFTTAAQLADDEQVEFQAWHNLGNSLLQQAKLMPTTAGGGQEGAPDKGQVLKSSIDAYKQALRLNPKDEDTRYNLAYAQKLLQQQEEQNQNSDQNNQDQDQQDQQNQDQQQQDQQNQDQQNQDQQQQDQQNQQQNQDQQQGDPQQSEQRNMTREEIERLLEALQYQEEKLQKELQKKKVKATKVKVEKDW